MIRLAPVILLAAALFSCSKKTNFSGSSANFNAELKTQSSDAVRISTELDAIFNDADSILENKTGVCGSNFGIFTADTPNSMAIDYTGNNCTALSSRTGTISIAYTPGTDFSTANDTVLVRLVNVTITRLADNKPIEFNGNITYVNNTGGKLANLGQPGAPPIVHTLRGSGITVTYDNGATGNFQFTRRRTYTYNQGIVVSTVGTDSAGTVGNVADWGANRFGNSVLIVPTTPLQISQSCGWRMTGGQATLSNPSGASTLSFGLDSTGKAASCPLAGNPYYFKLDWTGDGEDPFTALLPY